MKIQNTFASVWTSFRSTASTLKKLQNTRFECINRHFNCRKFVVHVVYFWWIGIKRSHRLLNQGCLENKPSIRCLVFQTFFRLSRCVRTRIVMRKNYSPILLFVSYFYVDFWRTNVVYYSEMTTLRYYNATIATWQAMPKINATICFDVLFPTRSLCTSFVRFDSSLLDKPHRRLLFCL